MVQQAIFEKQRRLMVNQLQGRMQNTILTGPNPLNDPVLAESIRTPMDLYMVIESLPKALIKCNVSRGSRAHIESGSMPPDEDVDVWDVVIPGDLVGGIRASHLAVVFPPDDSDPYRVFTITNINQDYLKVIARLTMQLYGVRRG